MVVLICFTCPATTVATARGRGLGRDPVQPRGDGADQENPRRWSRRLQVCQEHLGVYSEGTYLFKGSIDAKVCERVAAGVLLKLDLRGDRTIENNPNPWLLVKLCTALGSATCRLIDLNLGGNHLDFSHSVRRPHRGIPQDQHEPHGARSAWQLFRRLRHGYGTCT